MKYVSSIVLIRTSRVVKEWNHALRQRIANTYNSFTEEVGFSVIASIKEIAMNNSRLSISLYVRGTEIESPTWKHTILSGFPRAVPIL